MELWLLLIPMATASDATVAEPMVNYLNYKLGVGRCDLSAFRLKSRPVGGRGASLGPLFEREVNIFNVMSGMWTTASLSVARWVLAATSVSNLTLFGGCQHTSCRNLSSVGIFLSYLLLSLLHLMLLLFPCSSFNVSSLFLDILLPKYDVSSVLCVSMVFLFFPRSNLDR